MTVKNHLQALSTMVAVYTIFQLIGQWGASYIAQTKDVTIVSWLIVAKLIVAFMVSISLLMTAMIAPIMIAVLLGLVLKIIVN